MALTIQSIKKYNFYTSLNGRVCRVWLPKLNEQTSSFNCLLVDCKGNAIQASAKGKNIQSFSASIIEGNYYQISGFYTFENRYTNSVVTHEAIIDLKFDTKVTRLDPLTPPVPRHYFNFIDFAHMLTTGKRSGVLTDVLGRLKAVQPLEQIIVRGQNMTDKREFIIENIRGDELRVTLWGDVAKSFDDTNLQGQPSPFIIVFAGFRITEFKGKPNLASTVASLWYFNPDIPEALPYKHFYKDVPVEVHQLPPSTTAQPLHQQIKENRKTIKEILCMDPYQYKSERFTCKASIADYDLHRGWWYHSCPVCTKSVSDKGTSFRCIEHNEVTPIPWFKVDCIVTDDTDVTTFLMVGKTAEHFFGSSAHSYVYDKGFIDSIPPPMIDKLQKPKIFQLRFGTFRSIMNRCDIIVANVFDDIINIESPQQHVESALHDMDVKFVEEDVVDSSKKNLLTPQQHVDPSLHDMDVKFVEEAVADSSTKTLLSPQQHVEPTLHDMDVKFVEEAVTDSSKKTLSLDPVTPSHIPPSRAYADIPSQSQVAAKHLRFEDETSLKSSAVDATAKTPDIFPLLDDNASTMSKDKDPPKKRQCRSKSKND